MSEKEQISEEMANNLLDELYEESWIRDAIRSVIINKWKKYGYIKESAVDRFKNYKGTPSCNGMVPANDMAIIRTLGAEAIAELQAKIDKK